MTARAPLLLCLLLFAGCAYYNGMYNARQDERRGDRLARQGDDSAAVLRYQAAAEAAESVLVHHARSRWTHDARFTAGRSWALAGRCERALPHLQQWIASATADDPQRQRAALVYGRCLHLTGWHGQAREVLHPLSADADAGAGALRAEASLWAARAALALREYDRAHAYLRNTTESEAEWELALAYLRDGWLDAAESLILSRAASGDAREELFAATTSFWHAGRQASAERLVRAFDASAPLVIRARLHLLLGELLMGRGEDARAMQHLSQSRQLVREGPVSATASARITMLSLRDLPTLLDVRSAIGRGGPAGAGSPEHARLWSNALLTSMLAEHVDHSGAALFLAGEVARDSLRAPSLAQTLFTQSADQYPRSPVAPKALLAIAALNPDGPWYRARLLAEYPESPYAAVTRGAEPLAREEMVRADSLLVASWSIVARAHADSMARLGASTLAGRSSAPFRGMPQ
jgi:thioredoxin-like negative regulator of GroEL